MAINITQYVNQAMYKITNNLMIPENLAYALNFIY